MTVKDAVPEHGKAHVDYVQPYRQASSVHHEREF